MDIEQTLLKNMNEAPGYWFNKSGDLLRSAGVLWKEVVSGSSIGVFDVYKMLMGMSFEAMAKAHCVAQRRPFKANHQLTALSSTAGINFNKIENKILTVLTSYIEWAGKYPIPKGVKAPQELARHWNHLSDLGDEAFDFNNLLKMWRKMADLYMAKYNA